MVAIAVGSVVAAVGLPAATGTVAAQTASEGSGGTGYTLTIATRVCDTFDDIMANRARNNVQQSLRDLGKDTVYVGGQSVKPSIEEPNQGPTCRPMPAGFTFTLGNKIDGSVAGIFGRLSIVGNPNGTAVTEASVPELNLDGTATGATLASAVTFELTQTQLDLSAKANNLWVQGGTRDKPLNGLATQYAFGALRCSIDNLNGDNVEWIAFPQGTHHAFCYAYYVQPPPTSGTIVVEKRLAPGSDGLTDTFRFRGNISFTTDQAGPHFDLPVVNGAPASIGFYRAAGPEPWTIWEEPQDDWTITSASCTSSGNSISTSDPSLGAGGYSIVLAPGDVVYCIYENTPVPPPVGLRVIKVSGDGGRDSDIDAVSAFPITVTNAAGATVGATTIVTRYEGVAESADFTQLSSGVYTVSEQLPKSPYGTWKAESAVCEQNGQAVGLEPVATSIKVDLGKGPAECTFTNRLVYNGALVIRKITQGAPGVFSFVVERPPAGVQGFERTATAIVSRAGVPATAVGDLTELAYGRYTITETAIPAAPGDWLLVSVVCDGKQAVASRSAIATVEVTIDARDPVLVCTFTNRKTTTTPPPPPPPPTTVRPTTIPTGVGPTVTGEPGTTLPPTGGGAMGGSLAALALAALVAGAVLLVASRGPRTA